MYLLQLIAAVNIENGIIEDYDAEYEFYFAHQKLVILNTSYHPEIADDVSDADIAEIEKALFAWLQPLQLSCNLKVKFDVRVTGIEFTLLNTAQ